jgi:hypothetical protein
MKASDLSASGGLVQNSGNISFAALTIGVIEKWRAEAMVTGDYGQINDEKRN